MANEQIDNDADLRELENMAANLEQENAAPQDETAQETISPELQAYGVARMVCELAARGASLRWSCLTYGDEVKHNGAQVLVPLMLKYDIQSEFMARWSEEFAAGAFFAGVIFTSYQKVKMHEAAEKAKQAEQEAQEVNA